jgi:hypothetical protein
MPMFEWAKAVLKSSSAECARNWRDGKEPACTDVCPRTAVIFGKRADPLKEAQERIAENPERYTPQVYGETDGGGIRVLYLSPVPFDKLGIPALGDEPAPQLARSIQQGVCIAVHRPCGIDATLGFVMLRNRRSEDGWVVTSALWTEGASSVTVVAGSGRAAGRAGAPARPYACRRVRASV